MRQLLVLAAVLGLSACAVVNSNGVPGCHGPRRAANPNGSVLDPAASASAEPAASVGASACGRGRR